MFDASSKSVDNYAVRSDRDGRYHRRIRDQSGGHFGIERTWYSGGHLQRILNPKSAAHGYQVIRPNISSKYSSVAPEDHAIFSCW